MDLSDTTDVIIVEFEKSNGEDFKGTITYTEAKTIIVTDLMGLDQSLPYSIKFGYMKCPTVKYKLTQAVNMAEIVKNEC